MQYWLTAKAEEDRRSQEEERTRQESIRLEQRKVDQTILADSLRAGIPPHVVPFIFSGMNGGSNSDRVLDMLQQCMAHAPQDAKVPTALNPGAPVTLPLISQQSSKVTTPPESQSDWQKRMEAYFSARQAPPKKKKPKNDSLASASRASLDTPVASVPIPHTPQRPTQREPRSRQSPTPVSVYQWLPPYLPHSNFSVDKDQNEPVHSPKTSSQPQSRSQSSPNRKRKSQSSHREGPSPPSRLTYEPNRASRLDTQSPNSMTFHNFGPDRPHQPSDSSMSHESQTMDGESDQVREQAARLEARSTADTANDSVEQEDEMRSPGQYASNEPRSQSQAASDAESPFDTT